MPDMEHDRRMMKDSTQAEPEVEGHRLALSEDADEDFGEGKRILRNEDAEEDGEGRRI
jgi:hypothetical protein